MRLSTLVSPLSTFLLALDSRLSALDLFSRGCHAFERSARIAWTFFQCPPKLLLLFGSSLGENLLREIGGPSQRSERTVSARLSAQANSWSPKTEAFPRRAELKEAMAAKG
jgi:hypothetical protein